MTQERFHGTWYIVPTPFTQDDRVDEASIARTVERAAAWGADGVTVLGVMGEVTSLSDAEREAVLTTVAKAAQGRLPFAAGCSAASPSLVRERVRQAASYGAAAAMVAAPPLLPDVDGLARFFERVRQDTELPIIVQDEPNATGVRIPVSALLAAMTAAGSDVVKLEDPPTPPKITKLLAAAPGLTVFGGLGGVAAYDELNRGAAGTMTGFAFPEILKAVRGALEEGDRVRAARIFDRYLPYIAFEGQVGVGLAIRKEVLRRRGVLETARTRGLAPTVDEVTSAELDDVLARVGIVPGPEPLEVR
ncbi:dihydrodipicolinate synthase family protein [Streptosporangium carneum]|uniref:Dihydrodipicolinate synthase family protein n=1 Tax=Streptosporangium carneum TaxID=47481 RepID=A0A9W6IBY2_9ACTN|nr:dihydrodipicolinate synthase family protein [Streptosporangium carneum]GLK14764.1 dihydrodipicolinate synthase family protein [Streptosporangium carneum]